MLPFAAVTPRPRILSSNFAVLSAATVCFFLSLSILVPTLPKYLTARGAPPLEVGVAFGSMSLAAIVFRPFAGREIDRRSRKFFTSLGIGLNALACLLYTVAPDFLSIIAVRIVHGAAIACFYPGASTLTADMTPKERRAEALSYFSMFLYAGFAAGPALGEHLMANLGFRAAFQFAALLAAVGFVISLLLREPKRTPALREEPGPLLHRAAAFPALILGMGAVSFAAVGVFIPLYVAAEGKGDSRTFFLAMSVTIIVLRFFVGRVADAYGRQWVIFPGILSCTIAMLILGLNASPTTLLIGAVVFGIGWGALFPGLMATTIDRVRPEERGSATGTFTAAFDAAFGASTIVLGLVLQLTSFRGLFAAAGLTTLVATFVYTALRRRSESRFPALGLSEESL